MQNFLQLSKSSVYPATITLPGPPASNSFRRICGNAAPQATGQASGVLFPRESCLHRPSWESRLLTYCDAWASGILRCCRSAAICKIAVLGSASTIWPAIQSLTSSAMAHIPSQAGGNQVLYPQYPANAMPDIYYGASQGHWEKDRHFLARAGKLLVASRQPDGIAKIFLVYGQEQHKEPCTSDFIRKRFWLNQPWHKPWPQTFADPPPHACACPRR